MAKAQTAKKEDNNGIPDGHDLIYGLIWKRGQDRLALELYCYRNKRTVEEGGLGPYLHFKNAWKIVWPDFVWNKWTELMVRAWCEHDRISIMGHGAAGKTYTLAHIVYLDYMADPLNTMTSLTTVTADGLRLRMWGDLMRAHEAAPARYRLGFKVFSSSNRMNLMVDPDTLPPDMIGDGNRRDLDKYMIEGMSTSRTSDASGRIRGKHAPRRRVICDEADDMPEVIYETFGNVKTDPDVKIVDMSNAMDRYSNFGRACEPIGGWESIHDTDLLWYTKSGICVHLDGLQNPNIRDGGAETKFKYMLDQKRIDDIKKEFGEDSKEWWCFVRGFFPPDGIICRVWPSSAIEAAKKNMEFDFEPEPCATLDPAFEHDDCVLILGSKGKTREGKMAIQAKTSEKIKTVESAGALPKDYQVAHEVMRICKGFGVEPKNFIMDKTGGGRGVYAILQREWSPEVQGINYGGEATARPLRYGDLDKACDIVRYFVSELWFRARYMAEDGCICGLTNISPKTIEDLSSRRYETKQVSKGKIQQVETKEELKKRLGRSPDHGDAFVQFAELLAREMHLTVDKIIKVPMQQLWQKHRERAKKLALSNSDDAAYVEHWN